MSRRYPALWRALFALMALVVLAQVALEVWLHPRYESDTDLVVAATSAALRCLQASPWSRCPNVSRLPLLQHLPVAALLRAGLAPVEVLRGLTLLNAAAQGAIVVALFRALRGAAPGAPWLAVAGWLGGYGLWYVNSTFGESLAALLTLLAVWSCHRRAAAGAFVATWLASTSKEVAAPFLLALGGLALLLPGGAEREPRATRTTLAACGLGAAAGLASNALFNVWRFGGPVNVGYLDPAFRAAPAQSLMNFAGLWTSPNGGLLWFAPILMAAVLVAAAAPLRGAVVGPRYVARGALAILLALSVGFARWYAPMGWWAWGPRYLLPWLPAVLLLALRAEGGAWQRLATRLGPRGFAGLALALALLAVPNALSLLDSIQYNRFFAHNPACPSVAVQVDAAVYTRALRCMMFSPRSLWWWWLVPVTAKEPLFVASYVGVLWALLWRSGGGPGPEA